MRRARNECSIGDWRKDCFTGAWPGPKFAGEKYVSLPSSGHTGYKQYTDVDSTFYISMRWDHVKVSMLELQDRAKISTTRVVWM